MSFYIRKLLDLNQKTIINNIIDKANKNDLWIDGLVSVINGKKEIKKNFELSDRDLSIKINEIIMHSLDRDDKFLNFTAAKDTNLNLITKTMPSGYYNPHIDNWSNGDYSTTVFLNDPSEYDGGELCLLLGESEEKFKLESGYAITYPTGIIHRVNRVLSGVRYVSVFWTSSCIKDDFIRNLYYEISNILSNLRSNNLSQIHLSNCNSCKDDPIFMLDSLRTQILRKYGVF